jgi:branched-chain amino acid transport system permease protein
MTVFFVLTGWAVLLIRRGVVGRMLIAMRDSPAACGTLGLDQRWFRVGLFAVSAGIAGLAGALFAGLRQTVGAGDFIYFNSLLLLLCATVFGVTSVTGAVLGGVALMLLPQLRADHPSAAGLLFVVLAVGAVLLAKDPNGLASQMFKLGRWVERRIAPRIRANLPSLPSAGGDPELEGSVADEPEGVPAHAH